MQKRVKILFLCHFDKNLVANTILEYIEAFTRFSSFDIDIVNINYCPIQEIDLSKYQAIVFHYSVTLSDERVLDLAFKYKIKHFSGPKIVFIQDEYRWINKTVSMCAYLNISCIFSLVSQKDIKKLYPPEYLPNVRLETILTGYVSEFYSQLNHKPYEARSIDVGYRARKLPAWLGSLAQIKHEIASKFLNDPKARGLNCDISISEKDRLYGQRWADFLMNCKSCLGTESGASLSDFDGTIEAKVLDYTKSAPNPSFSDIERHCFPGLDNNIIMAVISPRIFEMAAYKTLMILYPGEYSGILKPNFHYVQLEFDHSNISDVVDIIRDSRKANYYISNAYQDLIQSKKYDYSSLVQQFDTVLFDLLEPKIVRENCV